MPKLAPLGRLAAVTVLALPFVAGACGSDDTSSSGGTTTTAPEEKMSSDAAVAEGLEEMKTEAAEIKESGASETSVKEYDEMHEVWETVEGTVKDKEPETYTDIEDAMSLISNGAKGEASKIEQGVSDFNAAADAYLEKHPA